MNILFLGDSLIEYFEWQERFPGHRVANLGMAGESVQGLLSRVVKVNEVCPAADVIVLMTGINNVAMGDIEFFEFYKIILDKLSGFYKDASIFLHSLLPTRVDFISNSTIQRVNRSLEKLAQESGVEYVDIYSRFIDAKGGPIKEYLLDDGVHLSRTGYDVWAKAVGKLIE